MNKWLSNRDVVSGSLLFLFSVWFFMAARSLPAGSGSSMPPGYFPAFLAVVLAFLSLLVVFKGIRESDTEYEKKDHKTVCLLVSLLIVYIILFKYMGFITSTIIYLTAAMILLKAGKLIKIIPVAVVIALAVYFIFSKGFHIPLG
ncbi:tripartite tricarboxylate transporter TctB family protein [Desulfofundulus salinus]|uniref:Tripartite tricarboxylate transporter TctB family protein n=1 Tax=Desulfofundulus salinus TaxID=2419843 RepID=A0A494WWQ4_9FIRM|nr:tripartite tricarboxylate transporter TctB family protein [Desulfofundulus salinum]MDK2887982.1 Tripartite tricarboxylate transporter TctB family [Thermoanaerobacter sp.]RKO67531.1 tripartite tricarboxylate transporter TctB family protein [Desulfofundulus salinum]